MTCWLPEYAATHPDECHMSTSTSSSSSSPPTTATPCTMTFNGVQYPCDSFKECPNVVSGGSVPIQFWPDGCGSLPTYPPTTQPWVGTTTTTICTGAAPPPNPCMDTTTTPTTSSVVETTTTAGAETAIVRSPVDSSTTAYVGIKPGNSLPVTGSDTGQEIGFGLTFAILGPILIFITRRRAHALRTR